MKTDQNGNLALIDIIARNDILKFVNRKTLILAVGAVCLVVGLVAFFILNPKGSTKQALSEPETQKEVVPSKTYIDYEDPAGFSFSYPDNISLANRIAENDDSTADPDAYADLQLFSKDKSGSINLRIEDTKLKTIDDWKKGNQIPAEITPTEKKLGSLTAEEFRTKDRVMLVSIDQGILFTVDMPIIEEVFWNEVYEKVISGFSFGAPETEVAQAGSGGSAAAPAGDEVIFEGEEVVE